MTVTVTGLLLLLALTRPTPDQVRDWTRVTPPPTSLAPRPPGTALTLDQLSIDPAFIADWSSTVSIHTYHHYLVAPSLEQTGPVLIVCLSPSDALTGPGCVEGYRFWFVDR